MYKKQMLFQRIVCLAALVSGVLVFVYALGLMTDLYETLYPYIIDKTDLDNTKIAGARILYDMQPFNNVLMYIGVALIVVSLTLFITCTHSRRKYYIGNFISTGLTVVSSLGVTVYSLYQVFFYRNVFLTKVDFDAMAKLAEGSKRYTYSDSTLWFDLSLLIFGIVLIVSALLVFNLIWKLKLMKEERSLLENNEIQVVEVS